MRSILLILIVFYLTACQTVQEISYSVAGQPQSPLQSAAQKMLLLTTFDPAQQTWRKNKIDLVSRLTDSLVKQMMAQLESSGMLTVPLYGVTPVFTAADEGSIQQLLQQHGATHAIVIKEVDVFFDQTGVEVTKEGNSKSREAFYDICTQIVYEIYNQSGKMESRPVQLRKPHSSRSVVSGVLAAGPSLTSNSKQFYRLAGENKDLFLQRYFSIQVQRQRIVFTDGAFQPVAYALRKKDYESALKESRHLAQSSNRQTAAKAYYNCAVLSERQNNPSAAQRYLQQSLHAFSLPEAVQMQNSLGK